MPVRYILSSVSKIKHIFSVIHYTLYGTVCFQFTDFPCDDWENIHFVLLSSSNRKYELGNKTMVCAVCLSLFLLVQIMACGLVSAKPLSAPKMWYYQLEPSNKFQWNFKRNSYVFIQENAFENVIWEMATTLSRLQWVKRPRVHWRCLGLARWGLSVVENIVLCVF